jgi:hypothetical protein
MPERVEALDQAIVASLRGMARQGRSPSELVNELKRRLPEEAHVLTMLAYFREAFFLTLAEVKPIAALSRNDRREIEDGALLDELLSPAILEHAAAWGRPEQ